MRSVFTCTRAHTKKVLRPWLEGAGYACRVVTTAEDALRDLQSLANNVSVVVADTELPGTLGGIALLDRIVRHSCHHDERA